MLVLSRKPGEKLILGTSIVITVIEVQGENVKLGIEAPKEIPIYRLELLEAIKQANIEAAAQPTIDFKALTERLKKDKNL